MHDSAKMAESLGPRRIHWGCSQLCRWRLGAWQLVILAAMLGTFKGSGDPGAVSDTGHARRPSAPAEPSSGVILPASASQALSAAYTVTVIVFEDCDIVRTTHIAMDIFHGDRATIRNIRFDNIRVELDDRQSRPQYQQQRGQVYLANAGDDYCPNLFAISVVRTHYNRDDDRGIVRNVLFKDITVIGNHQPSATIVGQDNDHNVSGVRIENLRFNGRRLSTAEEAALTVGPFAEGVEFLK